MAETDLHGGERFVMLYTTQLEKMASDPNFRVNHWRVYVYIRLNFNQGRGYAWPGIPYLMTATNLSRSSIKRALKDLDSMGYIRVIYKKGKGNQYHWPHCECGSCQAEILRRLMAEPVRVRSPDVFPLRSVSL